MPNKPLTRGRRSLIAALNASAKVPIGHKISILLPSKVISLVRPRRRLSLAPTAGCCRRRAQGVSRLAAFQRPPSGLGLYTTEHDGRLDGFGRFTPVLLLIRHRVSAALFRSRMCFRQVLLQSPWRVRCSHQLISGSSDPACQGAACMDDRAGGMGLIFRTADREPICEADQQSHIRPARHSRLRVSELSALSTLSRKGRSLRNQTMLEIAP